jgi:hypothetical protein
MDKDVIIKTAKDNTEKYGDTLRNTCYYRWLINVNDLLVTEEISNLQNLLITNQ